MRNDITIRKYEPRDRQDIRRISYATALLGEPQRYIDHQEIIADALTLYFTDREPESCLVASQAGKIVGFLNGTKRAADMLRIFSLELAPYVFLKALREGMFLERKTLCFSLHCLWSFFKGEFFTKDFTKHYPALFHINVDKNFQGIHIGSQLVQRYFGYLKENGIPGVYVCTMSDEAKKFFEQQGFGILLEKKRSYLRYQLGHDVPLYILGKKL